MHSLLKNAEHLVQGRNEQDVLYELLPKLGLDLWCRSKTKTIAGKSVHSIGGGALIVCLADGLTKDMVEPLATGIVAWRWRLRLRSIRACGVQGFWLVSDDIGKDQHGGNPESKRHLRRA